MRSDRKRCSVDDCGGWAVGNELCDKHYRRWRRRGTTDLRTDVGRFWSFVDKGTEDACWPWTGAGWPSGYGGLRIGDGKVLAHRFSYELHIGPIPDGLVVDHLCRNRACVNPRHLEAVTFRENVLRGNGAGAHHARKTECLRGHSFEPPNGYTTSQGYRGCRECDRIRAAAKRLRLKQVK